jgi:RNA polymerase sigma-70 factor (ECF subfamily)
MTTNDALLLTRAKALDPAALKTLHQQFYEPVARYIQFKVGDPATVEDLSGEVFVRVLENLRRGHGWQDSLRGWIMGIARNVVADYYRRRERMPEVMLDEAITSTAETDPTHRAFEHERRQRLMIALQQLTDEQRDVVLMRFLKGMDIQSVAEAVDKTPGAVKALQHRALRMLADRLRDLNVESGSGELADDRR